MSNATDIKHACKWTRTGWGMDAERHFTLPSGETITVSSNSVIWCLSRAAMDQMTNSPNPDAGTIDLTDDELNRLRAPSTGPKCVEMPKRFK
jgi:hypothetical protein